MCTIKFCSVVNLEAFCHQQDSLMRGAAFLVYCLTCTLPSKCWWHSTVQQWFMPKPDTGRKSRVLPQLSSPRRIIAITFGVEKLGRCGYPMVWCGGPRCPPPLFWEPNPPALGALGFGPSQRTTATAFWQIEHCWICRFAVTEVQTLSEKFYSKL